MKKIRLFVLNSPKVKNGSLTQIDSQTSRIRSLLNLVLPPFDAVDAPDVARRVERADDVSFLRGAN
jgi:hypothetical protein